MIRQIVGGLACLVLVLATGCQPGNQTNSGSGSAGGAGGTKRLAFITNNASDFWTIARKGCEKADNELADATVEFRIPSDGTAAEQKRIVAKVNELMVLCDRLETQQQERETRHAALARA